MEPETVNTFIDVTEKDNKNFVFEGCCLVLLDSDSFIGASPDWITNCLCCLSV